MANAQCERDTAGALLLCLAEMGPAAIAWTQTQARRARAEPPPGSPAARPLNVLTSATRAATRAAAGSAAGDARAGDARAARAAKAAGDASAFCALSARGWPAASRSGWFPKMGCFPLLLGYLQVRCVCVCASVVRVSRSVYSGSRGCSMYSGSTVSTCQACTGVALHGVTLKTQLKLLAPPVSCAIM